MNELLEKIDDLESEFDISIQSSLSLVKLGENLDDAFKEPIKIIDQMGELLQNDYDSLLKDIILERMIDLINKFESKIEQI